MKFTSVSIFVALSCILGPLHAQDDSTGVRALTGSPQVMETAVPSTVPSGTICGSPGEKKTVSGLFYANGKYYNNPTGWVLKCGGSEAVVTGTVTAQGCSGSCSGTASQSGGLWAITGSCPGGYTLKGSAFYISVDKSGGSGGSIEVPYITGVDAWCQKN